MRKSVRSGVVAFTIFMLLTACSEEAPTPSKSVDSVTPTESVDTTVESEPQVEETEVASGPDWSKYNKTTDGFYDLTFTEVWEDIELFNMIGFASGKHSDFSNAMKAGLTATPNRLIIDGCEINLYKYESVDDVMTEVEKLYGNVRVYAAGHQDEEQSLDEIRSCVEHPYDHDVTIYMRSKAIEEFIKNSDIPGIEYIWDCGIQIYYNDDNTAVRKVVLHTSEWAADNVTLLFDDYDISFHTSYIGYDGTGSFELLDILYE